ncbi:MAG: hypothetical protein QW666_00110 [Candidatus Woesearchaeota archaeon]
MKYAIIVFAMLMFSSGVLFAAAFQQETRTAFGGTEGRAISQDRIESDQIQLYKDKLVIHAEGLMYARVEDTKSMEPLLSKNSHTIEKKVNSPDELKTGDIISFYEQSVGKIIVHAIIETGFDELGWYARTTGYNNIYADPWKVRFENIKGVVVGILN